MVNSSNQSNNPQNNKPTPKLWFLKSVLLPFFITRLLLVVTGLLSPFFLPFNYTQEPEIFARGWLVSSNRLIDMWYRWDAGWYMAVIREGYRMVENVSTTSNLAFFPVFPVLVKLVSWLIPSQLPSEQVTIGIGLILSNLMLIGSLALLYQLTLMLFKNHKVAHYANWLILAFHTSFFLSSFYSESSLLFFSLLTLWLAKKKKWLLACLAASITGATRVVGSIIVLPLLIEYLHQKKWQLKNIDHSLFWFSLTPIGILLFFSYLYYLTGDFFASIKVQSAWGRGVANPIQSFFNPTGYWPLITDLDRVAIVGVISTSFCMMLEKSKKLIPLGIYSILLIVPTLLTGTLDSASRQAVVVFPVFIYWSYLIEKINNKAVKKIVRLVTIGGMMILQIILFARYSQFYWAG